MKHFLKYSCFIFLLAFAHQHINAQTIQDKLGAARNHPQAKENAAKADVYISKENRKKAKEKGIVKEDKVAVKRRTNPLI